VGPAVLNIVIEAVLWFLIALAVTFAHRWSVDRRRRMERATGIEPA
jgi:hypothetical protein